MPVWKQEIRKRLAPLKLEPAREAAIVEELSQHLDDCYNELLLRPPAVERPEELLEVWNHNRRVGSRLGGRPKLTRWWRSGVNERRIERPTER